MKALVNGALRRAFRAWPETTVVLVFLASRLVCRTVFDVRFDTTPVFSFIQYIDPWFVEHDFLRSLLHLHHQAPLQILIVQGCMKILGAAHAFVVLEALYVALGLLLALALLRVLRLLGAPALLSTIAVSLSTAWPTSAVYENWLFYHLPTAALFVFSLVALLRFYRRGTAGAAFLFFAVIATITLIRSTFGLLFVGAAAAILLIFPPHPCGQRVSPRRMILKAALLPFLVVALNAAKPRLVVGHDYGTALLWVNLSNKIFEELPSGEANRLIASGLLSAPGGHDAPATLVSAYGQFQIPHAPTGVPLLDLDTLPGNVYNPHALEHVLVAERYYRHDAIYLLTHYPGVYLRSVWEGLSSEYVSSAAVTPILGKQMNHRRLAKLESYADRALGGQADGRLILLMVGLPLAVLYGLRRVLGPRARRESERSSVAVLSYMLLTIAYVTGTTVLVSYGEFNRYRFDIDPLYLILSVLLLRDIGCAIKRRIGFRQPFHEAGALITCGRESSGWK
ncbi:MAG: hypothetical protein WCG85_05930 [Polyangia bacterium]